MWAITKQNNFIGYRTNSKDQALRQKRQYIEEKLQSETGALQSRLWNSSKKTIAVPEAEVIVLDMLEEQIKIVKI